MTAFARESIDTEQGLITVELRTVNHRYLDANYKLADALRPAEPALRELAGNKLARGKLDCLMRLQSNSERQHSLEIDHEQLQALLRAEQTIRAALPACQPLNPLEVLQFPGVCKTPETSDDPLLAAAANVFAEALDTLVKNRRREGEKLAKLIRARLDQVVTAVEELRLRLPQLMLGQRERILARIEDLEIEVDQSRQEQELAHLAQKADVDEELDRLETHVAEVRRTLDKGGPCGRRLDFLMQELNREANTLSSKSFASSTTQSAVDLKVLIEQMREQVQNIE